MHPLAAVFIVLALAATMMTLLLTRKKRFKRAWIIFASTFIIPMVISILAQLSVIPGMAITGERIPADVFVLSPIFWLIGLLLLMRANETEKMEKEYSRIVALNDLARSYLQLTDFSQAATLALTTISRSYRADGGVIYVLDLDQNKVRLLASYGFVPDEFSSLIDMANQMLKQDKMLFQKVADPSSELRGQMRARFEGAAKRHGYASTTNASIGMQGMPMGMVMLYSKSQMNISIEEEKVLDLLGFELGLWLLQSNSINSMRRMSETQRAMLEISLSLQQEITSEKIMKTICDRLLYLIPSRDLILYMYDPDRKVMWGAQALGRDAEAVLAEGEFPLSEAGLAGAILISGKPEIVPDTLVDGRGRQIPDTAKESSAMLALPLLSKGVPIGIIELHRDLPATFTKDELETASLFAQQAAVSIQNSSILSVMEKEKDKSKLYLDLLTHDVANLNTPLYSYFDMILNDPAIPEEKKALLRKAYGQVDKISSLLKRIRKLSKAELEDFEQRKTVVPTDVIRESIEELHRAFPHRKIAIEVHDLEPRVEVAAGEMLDEVFFNILHNAVKFTPHDKETKVDISLEEMEIKNRWYCAVRIADHGQGIPDEQKPNVFGKWKPAEASFARGFGIGLNTCKKLIEKYGGSIWVEDRVRGDRTKGACFVVTLPMVSGKGSTGIQKPKKK